MIVKVKSSRPIWVKAHDEKREIDLRRVLVEENGNITASSKILGIARSHAMRLLKKYDLTEFAAKLRLRAGGTRVEHGKRQGAVLGRPK